MRDRGVGGVDICFFSKKPFLVILVIVGDLITVGW